MNIALDTVKWLAPILIAIIGTAIALWCARTGRYQLDLAVHRDIIDQHQCTLENLQYQYTTLREEHKTCKEDLAYAKKRISDLEVQVVNLSRFIKLDEH